MLMSSRFMHSIWSVDDDVLQLESSMPDDLEDAHFSAWVANRFGLEKHEDRNSI